MPIASGLAFFLVKFVWREASLGVCLTLRRFPSINELACNFGPVSAVLVVEEEEKEEEEKEGEPGGSVAVAATNTAVVSDIAQLAGAANIAAAIGGEGRRECSVDTPFFTLRHALHEAFLLRPMPWCTL